MYGFPDPFAADFDDDELDVGKSTDDFKSAKTAQSDHVHIRIQQRNGRKTLTTIQGLPQGYDPKKVLKVAKKGVFSLFHFDQVLSVYWSTEFACVGPQMRFG